MAGLYIHIPFCLSKCIYCGFFSVASLKRKGDYLNFIRQEMQQRQHYLGNTTFSTLYFGGGTPTLLTIDELSLLFEPLHHYFNISDKAEITIEANPEQLTPEYCRNLHRIGINRISIGVQSFRDTVLQFMGRRHTAEEAMLAVENAAAAGFDNLSIDLIYGVAERQDGDWEKDLRTAFSLPIKHLSAYSLTVEENSVLLQQIRQQRHAPLTDEQSIQDYKQLRTLLPAYGFQQYEISNFCKAGWESKHNSAYWHQVPYLGLGAAAHSYDGHSRQWNAASLNRYFDDIAHHRDYAEKEELTTDDQFNEAILLGLRTREGISLDDLEKRFGTPALLYLTDYFQKEVAPAHYLQDAHFIRLTAAGELLADGIASGAFRV